MERNRTIDAELPAWLWFIIVLFGVVTIISGFLVGISLHKSAELESTVATEHDVKQLKKLILNSTTEILESLMDFQSQARVFLEPDSTCGPTWSQDTTMAIPSDAQLQLIVCMKQNPDSQLQSIVQQVSDPDSESYGNYLNIANVTEQVAPSAEARAAVMSWLQSNGITNIRSNANRDLLHIRANCSILESTFRTNFRMFKNSLTGRRSIRSCSQYSVPAGIGAHVDFVSLLLRTPSVRISPQASILPPSSFSVSLRDLPPNVVTPVAIRERYNVNKSDAASSADVSQAVVEFGDSFFSPKDLRQFFNNFVPYSNAKRISKQVGANDPDNPTVEASLDVQYIMAMGAGVPTEVWSSFEDIMVWAFDIGSMENIPVVHSVSFGWDVQGQPSPVQQRRLCAEFQKLAARGISILFASGDSGVGCTGCKKFVPSFPATCPYVTAVGGTRFINGTAGEEAAAIQFGSGGGFSTVFPRPSYQNSAVQTYLQSENVSFPDDSFFDSSGRAIPDVSALGSNIIIINDGKEELVAGTSASAPIFAGLISYLNDLRLQNNLPLMGFLNPWLYKMAEQDADAFFDVTEGSNPFFDRSSGGFSMQCCTVGFEATAGWDPVTGLGTPNFEKLAELAVAT